MIPFDVVIAHDEYSVMPTKYRLSNTFTGSACHASRGGSAGGPPPRRPAPPGPPARGSGGLTSASAVLQTGVYRPIRSPSAAVLAAATCFSTSGGYGPGAGVGMNCADNVAVDAAAMQAARRVRFTGPPNQPLTTNH